jgi:hypothetical protein
VNMLCVTPRVCRPCNGPEIVTENVFWCRSESVNEIDGDFQQIIATLMESIQDSKNRECCEILDLPAAVILISHKT